MTGIAILGAAGRMGANLIQAVTANPDAELVAAVELPGHPQIGRDAGTIAGVGELGVLITDDPVSAAQKADVLIDFTAPAALRDSLTAAESRCGLVIGTTGLDDKQKEMINSAGDKTSIVFAANYSTGVCLLTHLVSKTAAILGDEFDIEITESHHRFKKDAPSGTALHLAEAAADSRNVDLADKANYGRHGMCGERAKGEIALHAIRGGDIVGEHTVGFYGDGERIELVHKASSRMTFAHGAVRAAVWVAGKAPGVYSMQDVLEL